MAVSIAEQGSWFTHKESRFVMSTTDQLVLKPDPRRVAVIWSCNVMGSVFLTLDGGFAAGEGIALPLSVLPYHWLFRDLGGIVQGAVLAHSSAAAVLHVIEVLYQPPEARLEPDQVIDGGLSGG